MTRDDTLRMVKRRATANVLPEDTCCHTFRVGEGQQTKMELVYQYLTGPRFKHRVQAIVEKFTDMQQDLDKERKTMTQLGQSAKSRSAV